MDTILLHIATGGNENRLLVPLRFCFSVGALWFSVRAFATLISATRAEWRADRLSGQARDVTLAGSDGEPRLQASTAVNGRGASAP